VYIVSKTCRYHGRCAGRLLLYRSSAVLRKLCSSVVYIEPVDSSTLLTRHEGASVSKSMWMQSIVASFHPTANQTVSFEFLRGSFGVVEHKVQYYSVRSRYQ